MSLVVDDDATPGDCGGLEATLYMTSASLQTAVDDAIAGDVHTIVVCPGTYNALTITGANKLTIKAAVAGSFPTISAPVAPHGDIILIQAGATPSVGVVLDGLRIDGANFNNALDDETTGVRFQNSSGEVRNSIVSGVRSYPSGGLGASFGTAIRLVDDNNDSKSSTLNVKTASIVDFDKAGVSAEGPSKVIINKSYLLGDSNPTDETESPEFAGRGVALAMGATGSITGNSIMYADFGVYLSGTSKARVSGNMISSVTSGITLISSCLPLSETTSSNKMTANTIVAASSIGIEVASFSGPGVCTSRVDKNIISGNVVGGLNSSPNTMGVTLNVDSGGGAFADSNIVSGNTFFSLSVDVFEFGATNTKISKNMWYPAGP